MPTLRPSSDDSTICQERADLNRPQTWAIANYIAQNRLLFISISRKAPTKPGYPTPLRGLSDRIASFSKHLGHEQKIDAGDIKTNLALTMLKPTHCVSRSNGKNKYGKSRVRLTLCKTASSRTESSRLEKTVQYTVRNYSRGDEVAIAKIHSECFGPTSPERLMQWGRYHGVRPEDIFVGVMDGKLVSSVIVVFKQLHCGKGIYLKTAGISGVCTDSDYRKKGIVTNLMKLSLDHALRNGVSNASLLTGLYIPAHRIYERLGFIDIMTSRTHIKYIDYPFIFARWLRQLNRLLEDSKIAGRKLEGWEKTVVVIQLREVGTLSFKFGEKRFQRLKKPPKRADIEFSTDIQTYTKIMRGVLKWEDAVKTNKLIVKQGEPADIETLKRVLNWRWDD